MGRRRWDFDLVVMERPQIPGEPPCLVLRIYWKRRTRWVIMDDEGSEGPAPELLCSIRGRLLSVREDPGGLVLSEEGRESDVGRGTKRQISTIRQDFVTCRERKVPTREGFPSNLCYHNRSRDKENRGNASSARPSIPRRKERSLLLDVNAPGDCIQVERKA